MSPKVSEILRWTLAISALVSAVATALTELPELTLRAAVPAVLLVVGAWVAKSPWDAPKSTHVALAELPREWREQVLAKRRGR